jgi:serine/threonine-protein kinase
MNLADLQRRVDRVVKLDLSPLHDAYRAQGGSDLDGFLAFLGATRAIDPSVLKELHGMTEVETPSVRDLAYRGTMLAAWAKTAAAAGPTGTGGGPAGGVADAAAPAADARFQPISRLGEGAMGAIDIARDVYLRRKVALKTVLPEMAGHPEVLGRFLSEMQITAQLEHPNIVPVYALDVSVNGSLGYAMKLVQGRDLAAILEEAKEKIEQGQPLGEELALDKRLEYFIKVCDALEYAHSKGIVHRDLKPANIMIGRHNEVYLMDWGIARPMGAGGQALEAGFELPQQSAAAPGDLGRTRIGEAIGTPPYMSPEQASGKNVELDGKSDQYTMGLILQECVTLRTAVDGATIEEVLTKAILAKRDPVPVGDRHGAVPREIDAIVRKATRRDPGERYPSIRALADDVRRYLRGEAVEALPEGKLRRAGRWFGEHRMATVALLLGIGLVGAAGTIGALVTGQARIEAEHARELRVSQMAAESAIQTQLVDRDLTRYEAALTEFVGAAQVVLSKLPPSDVAPYFEESFAARETAPPDFGPSKRYGLDVSVLAPLTSVAPGVAREPLAPLLRSLGLLGPAFRALLLASSGADWRAMPLPAQRALLADVGVSAFRASLGLREGATLSFPGMASGPPVDPREAAYFKLAAGKAGVVWGTPTTVNGESILPASAALHDERGAFRGVALLEVSVSRLLARPTATDLDYVQSRSLVGRDGKLMAEDNKGGAAVPLAPEVAAAIAEGKSGSLVAVVNGRRYRYTYHPLSSLDWYYVAAGEVERMEESKEKIVTSDPRKVGRAPAPPPPPKSVAASPAPAPSAAPAAPPAEADAGQEAPGDGGAADAPTAPDAGLATRRSGVPGPLPRAATAPSGEAAPPPNPFDKWKVYERKKKP